MTTTKRPDTSSDYEHFYIADNHPGIVDRTTWDLVRQRRENQRAERSNGLYARANTHFLYGLVFCAKCDAPYKRKTMKGHNGAAYNA